MEPSENGKLDPGLLTLISGKIKTKTVFDQLDSPNGQIDVLA
ncbi:hypothetical protein [Paracoccus sp. 228]|nr:hypothetical protein [Paracoccus sp. 228]